VRRFLIVMIVILIYLPTIVSAAGEPAKLTIWNAKGEKIELEIAKYTIQYGYTEDDHIYIRAQSKSDKTSTEGWMWYFSAEQYAAAARFENLSYTSNKPVNEITLGPIKLLPSAPLNVVVEIDIIPWSDQFDEVMDITKKPSDWIGYIDSSNMTYRTITSFPSRIGDQFIRQKVFKLGQQSPYYLFFVYPLKACDELASLVTDGEGQIWRVPDGNYDTNAQYKDATVVEIKFDDNWLSAWETSVDNTSCTEEF